MRIHALIICLLLCVASAFAKDVITKTDGSKIDAKVEEITETVIKYRKASNPTGPIYTIPISSVDTVLYENGYIDTFNVLTNTMTVTSNQTESPSDDDLIRLADSHVYDNQSVSVSDAQLLKIAYSTTPSENLLSQAKKYRIIGYAGGGFLVIAGVVTGILLYQNNYYINEDVDLALISVAGGIAAGGAWWLAFNLKANSLMKQAKEIQSYSTTIFENEIMRLGNNSLICGINLMGNRMVNSHSLGLSLRFNF